MTPQGGTDGAQKGDPGRLSLTAPQNGASALRPHHLGHGGTLVVGSREGSCALAVRTAVARAAAGWFSLELPTWANTQGMKHEPGISTSRLTSSRMTAARGQARRNNSGPSRARVVNEGHDRVCANINNIGILAAPLPPACPMSSARRQTLNPGRSSRCPRPVPAFVRDTQRHSLPRPGPAFRLTLAVREGSSRQRACSIPRPKHSRFSVSATHRQESRPP